jgi:ribosomal protein S11
MTVIPPWVWALILLGVLAVGAAGGFYSATSLCEGKMAFAISKAASEAARDQHEQDMKVVRSAEDRNKQLEVILKAIGPKVDSAINKITINNDPRCVTPEVDIEAINEATK